MESQEIWIPRVGSEKYALLRPFPPCRPPPQMGSGAGWRQCFPGEKQALVSSHLMLGALGLTASLCHKISCPVQEELTTQILSIWLMTDHQRQQPQNFSKPLEIPAMPMLFGAFTSPPPQPGNEHKCTASRTWGVSLGFAHYRNVWHWDPKHLAAWLQFSVCIRSFGTIGTELQSTPRFESPWNTVRKSNRKWASSLLPPMSLPPKRLAPRMAHGTFLASHRRKSPGVSQHARWVEASPLGPSSEKMEYNLAPRSRRRRKNSCC